MQCLSFPNVSTLTLSPKSRGQLSGKGEEDTPGFSNVPLLTSLLPCRHWGQVIPTLKLTEGPGGNRTPMPGSRHPFGAMTWKD